ncbi:MAG: hypothetical protein PF572_03335 [Patescibacteria group bacterium]|jgi:hypothetical protein|nr:hypothetical protein [Patescibacteria group bacterium]
MINEDSFFQGLEKIVLPPREKIIAAINTSLNLERSKNSDDDLLKLNEIFISTVAKNIEGSEKYFRTDGLLQEFYKELVPVVYEILSSAEYSDISIPDRWKNLGEPDNSVTNSVTETIVTDEAPEEFVGNNDETEEIWGIGKGVSQQTEAKLDAEAEKLKKWREDQED